MDPVAENYGGYYSIYYGGYDEEKENETLIRNDPRIYDDDGFLLPHSVESHSLSTNFISNTLPLHEENTFLGSSWEVANHTLHGLYGSSEVVQYHPKYESHLLQLKNNREVWGPLMVDCWVHKIEAMVAIQKQGSVSVPRSSFQSNPTLQSSTTFPFLSPTPVLKSNSRLANSGANLNGSDLEKIPECVRRIFEPTFEISADTVESIKLQQFKNIIPWMAAQMQDRNIALPEGKWTISGKSKGDVMERFNALRSAIASSSKGTLEGSGGEKRVGRVNNIQWKLNWGWSKALLDAYSKHEAELKKPYINKLQIGIVWNKITHSWLHSNDAPEFLQNIDEESEVKMIKDRLMKRRGDLLAKFKAIKAWKEITGNPEPPFPVEEIEECWDDLLDHFEARSGENGKDYAAHITNGVVTTDFDYPENQSDTTNDEKNENGKRASMASIERSRKLFPRSTPKSFKKEKDDDYDLKKSMVNNMAESIKAFSSLTSFLAGAPAPASLGANTESNIESKLQTVNDKFSAVDTLLEDLQSNVHNLESKMDNSLNSLESKMDNSLNSLESKMDKIFEFLQKAHQ
jgi:hypothetical protein